MKNHQGIIFKWDDKLYKDREQTYNSKITERNRLLKMHPDKKNLISKVCLRDERTVYLHILTANPSLSTQQKFRDYTNLYSFGNISYLSDFGLIDKLNDESNDGEASENESLIAPGNAEISKAPELGTPQVNQLPLSTKQTRNIHSWFPIWQNGVCRIVGQITSTSKKPSSKLVITGTILSYSETNQTFTTLECNYKFTENIDKKSLAKYLKIDPDLSFLNNDGDDDMQHSRFRQDDWLKNMVQLSMQTDYELFRFSSASSNKFLSKDRKKHLSSVLYEKKAPHIRQHLVKSVKCADYESICEELKTLLEIVQSDGDWLKTFQRLLKKCGQNIDHIQKLKNTESFHDPFSFRENDLNETFETLSYEEFSSGKKFNSTFTNIEAQLILWSIVKDVKGRFCITGLTLVDQKKKFSEIKPTPITTVIDDGQVVIADKCCYKLLGPLYALSVRLAYSDFQNSDYLWPFLPYFMTGLPKNWKNYIYIIDILSKCSLLHYVPTNISSHNLDESNSSDKTVINQSPSFIPSISNLSSNNKDLSQIKENQNRNYRKSLKRNSIIDSKRLQENNSTNNDENNDIFKENDKAICKRLSDMTNVFCSMDQTENISKNRKSILKKRTCIRNVCATSSLDANSIIENFHEVTVEKPELPARLGISGCCDIDLSISDLHTIKNNKINPEHNGINESVKWRFNRNQPRQSKSKFTEQEGHKTPETKVKKTIERDKKISNLRKAIIEDFQCSAQIFGDLDSSLSVGRTPTNTMDVVQSQTQSICSRKRKSQHLQVETHSMKKRLINVKETKVSQNNKSIVNENRKLKSVGNVEETKRKYNRKSVVIAKSCCSSVSKVRFSLNLDTSNQTVREKRNSVNKSREVQEKPIDSEEIKSDFYFQANSFMVNIITTRSGRKSIPPIDPRSDIERFNEGGKAFLISKGQKFELLSPNHPS